MSDEKSLQPYLEKMRNYTDLIPWYWIACGEKCYSFAVVAAFPLDEAAPAPKPGSMLIYNDDGEWEGDNGTIMMIDKYISEIEQQNGGAICSFIAAVHAHFFAKDYED